MATTVDGSAGSDAAVAVSNVELEAAAAAAHHPPSDSRSSSTASQPAPASSENDSTTPAVAAPQQNGDSRAVPDSFPESNPDPESASAAATATANATTTATPPTTVTATTTASSASASSGPASDMANYHPGGLPPVHHGIPVSYAAGSSIPSSAYSSAVSSLPTTQYASYSAVTAASQPGDGYRVSPVGSSPMSLPSMRTIDALSQHQQQQQQQQQQQPLPPAPHHSLATNLGVPLTSVSAGTPYYSAHSMPIPSNYGLPHENMTRYALPHDPRLLGHRGPKKEIKRRTKTGCLTCRKRRIKCDETHPTCNNCRKSKRDCLGYDPIFRQQGGNLSGGNLQPAQGNLPSSTPPSVVSSTAPNPVAGHVAVPRPPNSYGSQPSMLPSAYASNHSPVASNPAPIPSSNSNSYNATIPLTTPVSTPSVKLESNYDHPILNTDPSRSLPPVPTAAPSRTLDQKPVPFAESGYQLRASKMRIDEIIDLLGPPAPVQQISHTEETFNEITKAYHEMYAGGLSAFFETTWYYFVEHGKMTFPKDANLIEHMASFLKILEAVKANDLAQMAYSGVLETRIVWDLARTAYQIPERGNNAMRINLPLEGDPTEARNRLQVVEALLCGDYLSNNPLAPPAADVDQHRTRQFDFWYCLAEFVRKRDNPNAPATVKVREDVLSRMRHLLDGRENRDVLYSIAVVRELAPNFDPGYGNSIPQHLDETDPKNRLAVASKFIMDESQVTGGTTNVVRRFSDIACRAFVNPGVNVPQRS